VRSEKIAQLAGWFLAVGLIAMTGCGPSFGAWLYTLNLVPKEKSVAEYKLPKGPLLVLVDDDQDLIHPPTAREALVEALAKQLKEHQIADRITTNDELAKIRHSEPKFDQRGAREVGRLAKADTVLWLSVKQFALENDLDIAVTPATFAVALKVVDAQAERREDVRLWPLDREGKLMVITVSPQDIRACKSLAEVHQKLADEMADKIAKLFYDFKIEQ